MLLQRGSKADRFFIRKHRRLVEEYLDVFDDFPHANVVELGIAEGGSVALTALVAPPKKLVSTLGDKTLPYPWPGAKPATDFVTSKLGRHDALPIPWPGHFSYAWESGSSDGVEAQPSYPDGFWPTFGDSRIHLTGSLATADQVVPAVEGADRVFVYIPNPFDSVEVRGLPSLGFKSQQAVSFGAVRVQVWRRSRSEVWRAANRINVKLGDLPAGWGRTPSPANPSAIRTFNCLQVPKATASSFVTSAGPRANSQLLLFLT